MIALLGQRPAAASAAASSSVQAVHAVERTITERQGDLPYLIRQERPVETGGGSFNRATGIQRLVDLRPTGSLLDGGFEVMKAQIPARAGS